MWLNNYIHLKLYDVNTKLFLSATDGDLAELPLKSGQQKVIVSPRNKTIVTTAKSED